MSKQELKQKGFTIIEVVLVLAIAALIFLMVFIALPALQKGQRDTQRKDDLSRVNTQIQNYASGNRGAIPTVAKFTGASGFVQKYLGGNGSVAGSEYADPQTGSGYEFKAYSGASSTDTEPDAVGKIAYYYQAKCGDDGATVASTNLRDYALQIKLENQTSVYCLGSQQ